MNFFVCLVFVIGICYVQASVSEESKKKLREHQKICLEQTGIDKELVTKARNGEFADDQKLKEYVFCINKRSGVQNDAGKMQPDVFETKIAAALGDAAFSKKLVKDCVKDGENKLDAALNLVKCCYDKTHFSVA